MAITQTAHVPGPWRRGRYALQIAPAEAALLGRQAAPASAEGATAIQLPEPAGFGATAFAVNPAGVVAGVYGGIGFMVRAAVWIPQAGDGYAWVDLHASVGSSYNSWACAINPAGLVAGWAEVAPYPEGGSRPAVWRPDGHGGYTALSLDVPAGWAGEASAINPDGVVAGTFSAMGQPSHAAVWRPDGHGGYGPPEDLGPLGADFPSCAAYGINHAGTVVGNAAGNVNIYLGRAALWTSARAGTRTAIDLGTLAEGTFSSAYGIDAAGVVAGYSDGGGGTGGVVWKPAGDGGYEPAAELPTLPGGMFASVRGIGERGVIVGASVGADYMSHATIWMPESGGQYRAVSLGGTGYEALASAGGFVAGTSIDPTSIFMQAMVWRLHVPER